MSGTALDTHKTPILPTIASPADLRRLPVEALPQVCAEIREFLIDSLSRNPGHFASSMGAVEITVALHYVFDTPYDRIVWDVGHPLLPKANTTLSLPDMPRTPYRQPWVWLSLPA